MDSWSEKQIAAMEPCPQGGLRLAVVGLSMAEHEVCPDVRLDAVVLFRIYPADRTGSQKHMAHGNL